VNQLKVPGYCLGASDELPISVTNYVYESQTMYTCLRELLECQRCLIICVGSDLFVCVTMVDMTPIRVA